MASELIRRCERCRALIEPSYPCFNCGHLTDVAKEEDSKLATTYTIDGKALSTNTAPEAPSATIDDILNDHAWCKICNPEPRAGILDPYAWALVKAKLEAEAPATVDHETAEWLNAPMGPYPPMPDVSIETELYTPEPTRTPDGGSRAYRALLDQMWQLHIAKNTGYAGYSPDPWANFRQCESFGIPAAEGVLTRMSDKWSRLQSLWANPERDCVGESVKDTLVDLSAYALILVCLLEEDE